MRLLFFLALALLVLGLLRAGRRRQVRPPPEPDQAAKAAPQEMVRCAYCGLHLPQGEALAGRAGLYCSSEHRQLAE